MLSFIISTVSMMVLCVICEDYFDNLNVVIFFLAALAGYIYYFKEWIFKIVMGGIAFAIIYFLGEAIFEHSDSIKSIAAGAGGIAVTLVSAFLDNSDAA